MRVTTLLENTTISKEYKCKHGLSLYIETEKHKILFDMGSDDTFIKNADKMGINLQHVDIAIISHGHYDHGGGLGAFLKINSSAKIYVGKGAFDRHLSSVLGILKFNIALDKDLAHNNRLVFVDKAMKLDEEITLFGSVEGGKLLPSGNDRLLKEYSSGEIRPDNFRHEIDLIINEHNKYSLFCGCSHNGIVNIIDRAKNITNKDISHCNWWLSFDENEYSKEGINRFSK